MGNGRHHPFARVFARASHVRPRPGLVEKDQVLFRTIAKLTEHLFVGVAEVPAAYFEGIADNIRSTTEARRLLRIEAAKSLANGFKTNSKLAARAYAQHAAKILKEQVNVEEVLGITLQELSNTKRTDQPKGVPDDDWLAGFRNEASQRSSEEMRYVSLLLIPSGAETQVFWAQPATGFAGCADEAR